MTPSEMAETPRKTRKNSASKPDAQPALHPMSVNPMTVDLLILGGGIYGATAAYEASRRDLSALLIERDDFGAATSQNSMKIAHGVAAWALPLVRDQSGAISLAYLEAAATGEGAGAIHHVLEQLSSSERPDFTWTIEQIDRIGHTSGWDCLAGVTAVCRILSEQPETRKNCR